MDLRNDPKYNDPKNSPVSYSEGVELAKKHGCVGYLETSALDCVGMDFGNAAIAASCKQENYKSFEQKSSEKNCNLQ
jgi:hypothetical protein